MADVTSEEIESLQREFDWVLSTEVQSVIEQLRAAVQVNIRFSGSGFNGRGSGSRLLVNPDQIKSKGFFRNIFVEFFKHDFLKFIIFWDNLVLFESPLSDPDPKPKTKSIELKT
jgi:hypothetical protein